MDGICHVTLVFLFYFTYVTEVAFGSELNPCRMKFFNDAAGEPVINVCEDASSQFASKIYLSTSKAPPGALECKCNIHVAMETEWVDDMETDSAVSRPVFLQYIQTVAQHLSFYIKDGTKMSPGTEPNMGITLFPDVPTPIIYKSTTSHTTDEEACLAISVNRDTDSFSIKITCNEVRQFKPTSPSPTGTSTRSSTLERSSSTSATIATRAQAYNVTIPMIDNTATAQGAMVTEISLGIVLLFLAVIGCVVCLVFRFRRKKRSSKHATYGQSTSTQNYIPCKQDSNVVSLDLCEEIDGQYEDTESTKQRVVYEDADLSQDDVDRAEITYDVPESQTLSSADVTYLMPECQQLSNANGEMTSNKREAVKYENNQMTSPSKRTISPPNVRLTENVYNHTTDTVTILPFNVYSHLGKVPNGHQFGIYDRTGGHIATYDDDAEPDDGDYNVISTSRM